MKRRRDGSTALPPSSLLPSRPLTARRPRRPAARNPQVRLTLIHGDQSLPAAPLAPARAPGAEHLDVAADLLALAAGSTSVRAQGDALLIAIEHAARALEALFDRETARRHLTRVAEGM